MSTPVQIRPRLTSGLILPSPIEISERYFTPPVAPSIVDLEITGRCPYRCEFCHGPDHALTSELNSDDWSKVIQLLHYLGTSRFVITGGEPLLRPDIEDIIDSVPDKSGTGCETSLTLSTTGYGLLDSKRGILEILSRRNSAEIGIPIDAPSSEQNAIMRPKLGEGGDGGLDLAVQVLRLLQQDYPNIRRKLRTVVTANNVADVVNIPLILLENGVDLSSLNWKVYEANPYVGERVEAVRDMRVHWSTFKKLGRDLVRRWGSEFESITLKTAIDSCDRYMFIDPLGNVRTILKDRNGKPLEVELGSLRNQPMDITDAMLNPYELMPRNAYSYDAWHLATRRYFL